MTVKAKIKNKEGTRLTNSASSSLASSFKMDAYKVFEKNMWEDERGVWKWWGPCQNGLCGIMSECSKVKLSQKAKWYCSPCIAKTKELQEMNRETGGSSSSADKGTDKGKGKGKSLSVIDRLNAMEDRIKAMEEKLSEKRRSRTRSPKKYFPRTEKRL